MVYFNRQLWVVPDVKKPRSFPIFFWFMRDLLGGSSFDH